MSFNSLLDKDFLVVLKKKIRLIAAATEKCNVVAGEHVRIASTEII